MSICVYVLALAFSHSLYVLHFFLHFQFSIKMQNTRNKIIVVSAVKMNFQFSRDFTVNHSLRSFARSFVHSLHLISISFVSICQSHRQRYSYFFFHIPIYHSRQDIIIEIIVEALFFHSLAHSLSFISSVLYYHALVHMSNVIAVDVSKLSSQEVIIFPIF